MSKEIELRNIGKCFQFPPSTELLAVPLSSVRSHSHLHAECLNGPSYPRNGTLYSGILFPVHPRDLWHSKTCVCMNGGEMGTSSYNHLAGEDEGTDSKYSHLPGGYKILQSYSLTIPKLQPLMWYRVLFTFLSTDGIESLLFWTPFPQALLN